MSNSGLLLISDLSKKEITEIIAQARAYSSEDYRSDSLSGTTTALCFFEQSTRTRIGMESAVYRLGGNAISMNEPKYIQGTSRFPESFHDTIRVVSDYADLLCIRHADETWWDQLSPIDKPMINCGNGTDEHPTQTLIDLASILEFFGPIKDVKITLVGNLKHSRAAHSLVRGLMHYPNVSLELVCPDELSLSDKDITKWKATGNQLVQGEVLDPTETDVLYMAGFPRKLPGGKVFPLRKATKYQLNPEVARNLPRRSIVLCPLPRIDEITSEIDSLPQAKYFEQSRLGLFVRMVVLERFAQTLGAKH